MLIPIFISQTLYYSSRPQNRPPICPSGSNTSGPIPKFECSSDAWSENVKAKFSQAGEFDRNAKLPNGATLEQADGTAWMAFFCQNMLENSLEPAGYDAAYSDAAQKFAGHYLWVASAMSRIGENSAGWWNKQDGFFYDVLRFPDGHAEQMKVRSLVGLLSLCATSVVYPDMLENVPTFKTRLRQFLDRNPHVIENLNSPKPGYKGRFLLSTLNETRLRRLLARMLDESEFLSPHGIRSISKYRQDHPYFFKADGQEFSVNY